MAMPQSITEQEAPVMAENAAGAPTLQEENASLRDRLLRALADAENTRRRADRSAEEARRYAISDLARELLTVVDNLQRAIAAAETQGPSAGNEPLLVGIRATERMLMRMLERFGVRRIDADGAPFDPALHEAMMEENDPSLPPGTVLRVVEDGYTINDRLLRPARVVVVRRGARPASGSGAPEASAESHHGRQNGSP
jgi:molecular chaperone GrpE